MKKSVLNMVLLSAGYVVRHADWNWKGIYSPFVRLYLVTEGEAFLVMNNQTHSMTPGHLYYIPSYTLHDCICHGDFVKYYFMIYDEDDILGQWNLPFEIKANTTDEALVKWLYEINPEKMLKNPDPKAYDNLPTFFQTITDNRHTSFPTLWETNGIIMLLLSKFMRQSTTKDKKIIDARIIKVLHYIRDNIDKKITISDLASSCLLTKEHLIRIFKKEMKCSPGHYINRKKIEKAQLMLVMEQTPIKEIAYSLSFENIPHFHTLFKTYTGMTPRQYRMKSERNIYIT
ncbi:transcriptional regulator [Bacteroidia bacterium]|nr:transcriptional regulator [Bacteroidia bacterium]